MINQIYLLISILLLWIFWHFIWRLYALDKLRTELFILRRKLFYLAMDNEGISFEDELYDLFENLICGTIRFAHRINIWEGILFWYFLKRKAKNVKIKSLFEKRFVNLIKRVDDEDSRKKIYDLKSDYEHQIFLHLFRSHITVFIIVIFAMMTLIAIELISFLGRYLKRFMSSQQKITYKRIRAVYESSSEKTENRLNPIVNELKYQAELVQQYS
jgi:hypothetical protein